MNFDNNFGITSMKLLRIEKRKFNKNRLLLVDKVVNQITSKSISDTWKLVPINPIEIRDSCDELKSDEITETMPHSDDLSNAPRLSVENLMSYKVLTDTETQTASIPEINTQDKSVQCNHKNRIIMSSEYEYPEDIAAIVERYETKFPIRISSYFGDVPNESDFTECLDLESKQLLKLQQFKSFRSEISKLFNY